MSLGKLGLELVLILAYVSGLQSLTELISFATSEMLLDGSFEVGC